MCDEISTVILTESERTKDVLALYLKEFGKFSYAEDLVDLSEVFNSLSSLPKSLLLVDLSYNLPKYLKFIKHVSIACPACKIVAISDSPSVEVIVQAMRAGAKEFLPAPVIKAEFFEIFASRVKRKFGFALT